MAMAMTMTFSANLISHRKTHFPFLTLPRSAVSPSLRPPPMRAYRPPANRRISAAKVAADIDLPETISSDINTGWGEFARNVSGEWDGYGADFTSNGKPIELPESVVPEAYREWEVKVFDWQTQCPTLAEPEELAVMYKLIKLLPTVGCEADAATRYSTDERHIGGASNEVTAFAYHLTGCYLALWPLKDQNSCKMLELEHCLVDPQNKEIRIRVIQVIRVEGTVMKMCNIKVFCEQWYGPFRNGDQLGGCSIRDSGFASTEALKESEVTGLWEGPSYVTSFQGPQMKTFQELKDGKPQRLTRDQNDFVLLPRQIWCSLKERDSGGFLAEVGWLLDQGQALSSKFVFSSQATLQEVTIGRESSVQ